MLLFFLRISDILICSKHYLINLKSVWLLRGMDTQYQLSMFIHSGQPFCPFKKFKEIKLKLLKEYRDSDISESSRLSVLKITVTLGQFF